MPTYMTSYRSRYVRPKDPPPMQLTARDRTVLLVVHRHRYLTSSHLKLLVFPEVSDKVMHVRLRKLWEHGFLDRFFMPVVLTGIRESTRHASRPLYTLGKSSASIVVEHLGIDLTHVPCTPAKNAVGYATLEHHLIVTEYLVALEVACRQRDDLRLVAIDRESTLRTAVARWREQQLRREPIIVSDAAFTIEYADRRRLTYHLEVVRADVKGGNKKLADKLNRYVHVHRDGFFRRVYGHETIRAVLVATTSAVRAAHFRTLVAGLPGSHRLFWFGSFDGGSVPGVPLTSLTPASVLGPCWLTFGSESLHSLAQAGPSNVSPNSLSPCV